MKKDDERDYNFNVFNDFNDFNEQQKEAVMKKQLLIAVACFIGAFVTVPNINAEDQIFANELEQINSRQNHGKLKENHHASNNSKKKSGFSLKTNKGGVSVSIGENSRHQREEKCPPYYYQSRGTIISICEGVRLYLPRHCRYAHLQKRSRYGRCWRTVKYYRVIR